MRLPSIPRLLTVPMTIGLYCIYCTVTPAEVSAATSVVGVPAPHDLPLSIQPWQQQELWLFGGGEQVCSSIEPQYCEPESLPAARRHFATTEALTEKQYLCNASSSKLLRQLTHWPADSSTALTMKSDSAASSPRLAQLLAVLPSKEPVSATRLAALLQPYGLNDDETTLIEDACEVLQYKADQQPKQVELYWPGTDPLTRQMFSTFVQSAQARKTARSGIASNTSANPDQPSNPAAGKTASASGPAATILLLTASSYNPYEWVNYYQQLFEAAGATVIWLPIEAAWSQQQVPDCSQLEISRLRQAGQLRRAELYPQQAAIQQGYCRQPERLLQAVEQADAVFINGGDQSLTLRALTNAQGQWLPFASRLLQRVRHEGVILGGSSAGNAVQAGRLAGDIAMISGGRFPGALRHPLLQGDIDRPGCALWRDCQQADLPGQLSFRKQGGLQLFSLGSNDTHFFERRREARLLTLVSVSGAGAGFGIDEATVLRARFHDENRAELSVLGHGGVWIIDSFAASKTLQIPPPPGTQHITGLQVSRIFAGDSLWFTRPTASTAKQHQPAHFSVLTHSCHSKPHAATQVDADAYANATAAELQLRWIFGQAGVVDACQLPSGRWRYLQQPMQLQLQITPAIEGSERPVVSVLSGIGVQP